jgi:7-cyano-7-deazaguanine synthase in queuosine biosynthesis
MGSRTGASYTSIVGRNRKIHKDVSILSKSLSAITMQSSNSISAQPDTSSITPSGNSLLAPSVTPLTTQSETSILMPSGPSLSKEECEARAKIAMSMLINSNPVLAVAYYTLSFVEKVVTWYPQIEEAYQRGGDDAVIQLLMEKALQIGINLGINMIVSEIADQSWTTLKTEAGIETTPSQDQVAKLVINKALKAAIDAAKDGRPIDGELVYKQVCSALFDYFADSLIESKSDGPDPTEIGQLYHNFSKLDPMQQKMIREAVKKISMEIADDLFEKSKERRTPRPVMMRKRLIGIVKDRYSYELTDKDPYDNTQQYTSKNIIITDEKKVRNTRNSLIITSMSEVNHHPMSKDNQMRLSFGSLNWEHTPEEKDLANFAAFLFHMESLIRNKPEVDKSNILPKKVTFTVHSETDGEMKILMEQLLAFLLGYHPQFEIIEKNESRIEEDANEKTIEKIDAVCLYSGGLDSTIGYFSAKTKYKKIKLVFVDHEIHKIAGYVNGLVKELGAEEDLLKATSLSGGTKFLQQTRGFLYLTAAAIYANHLKSERIVISECGVTKYQPSITIADEITKTTHPYMLKLALALFKKKGINIALSMPFDDLTKAEMVSLCRDRVALLKETYSCRGGIRTAPRNKAECGYCMGCLIKNIALTYVTGQKQEQFLLDPLTRKYSDFEEIAGKHIRLDYGKMESMMALIDFTSSILRSDGSLHQTTLDTIEAYHKADLFRRFSEDIIYGLFYMKRNNMLQNEEVLAKLEIIEHESWFDANRINERREELLQQNKKPIW